MPGWRGGRWRGRLNKGQIEELAVRKIEEFRRKLKEAGLDIPEIPPIPAEYIALTITELGVRSVKDLSHEGRNLAGLLDMDRGEILYEEADPAGRQNFTIAHEMGHFFLHYEPAVQAAHQPSLFDNLEVSQSGSGQKLERASNNFSHYYRCTEQVVTASATVEDGETYQAGEEQQTYGRIGKRQLEEPDSKAYLSEIIRRKELADRIEWEANIFAGGLLMPSDLVRQLNKRLAGDVNAMASELAVSPTALRYRLNGLRLRQDENMGLSTEEASNSANQNTPRQGTFF
ncbi:MAG TPA: ImmA/IrrE family metallo-endopeptidase [Chloroflexia bacterium]|nr:ImmA/IrrE family metallo-endopeptidase [Chloroflexia bacterium]